MTNFFDAVIEMNDFTCSVTILVMIVFLTGNAEKQVNTFRQSMLYSKGEGGGGGGCKAIEEECHAHKGERCVHDTKNMNGHSVGGGVSRKYPTLNLSTKLDLTIMESLFPSMKMVSHCKHVFLQAYLIWFKDLSYFVLSLGRSL